MARSTTLRREVLRADPDFNKDRRKDLEYDFSNGRKFYRNPDQSEIYNPSDEEEE
jgi:hypothetical protein